MKRTYIKATKQIKSGTPKNGEPIEIKIARLLSQEEPIKDQVPLIYTERKTGVNPEYNIRTDRFMKAYRDWETDRKSTRLNSSHSGESRMPSSA